MSSLEEMPERVFVSRSKSGKRDVYHTSRECLHVAPGFREVVRGDPGYSRVLDERGECQWCRYETLEITLEEVDEE